MELGKVQHGFRRESLKDKDATYNVLLANNDDDTMTVDHEDDDHDDEHGHDHHKTTPEKVQSLDYNENESAAWKKHSVRNFFQDRGKLWKLSRRTNAWKWLLIVITGVGIGLTGAFVSLFLGILADWKLQIIYKLMTAKKIALAFFVHQFFSIFYALCSGFFCLFDPYCAGSGIPEVISFLNGMSVDAAFSFRVLVLKVPSMCFSVAAGLPMGKEGPMIHAGAVIGAVCSQGYTLTNGFDNSWKRFQGLRTDTNKRDFVTYGAAAGISGAFRAPIGGILFALEEGASYWSTSVTLRAFICGVICQLSLSAVSIQASQSRSDMFAFGQFENLRDGSANYSVWEVPIFFLMGCTGGVLGALFNYVNKLMTIYRINYLNHSKFKRMCELVAITLLCSLIHFIFSICWPICTPMPTVQDYTTVQEELLFEQLVQFQCPTGYYNQLASLNLVTGDVATRQLFHFREFEGEGFNTFSYVPLIMFFIPYFFTAAITAGIYAPAGLFVPTLLAGAGYGRIVGHFMNTNFPGYVADSGTYALIGAASVLGGMARMTIAGTIICLEACGNMVYLLPLMVTFTGSRYAGNPFGLSMYEMQIAVRKIPFLEPSLHNLGLLNYQAISEIMTKDVITLREVGLVSQVMHLLTTTNHNAFPVVSEDGLLRGLILRRTLCSLLTYKAYSVPTGVLSANGSHLEVVPASTVAYDTFQRTYPNFPDVSSIRLSEEEMNYWLDLRPYMDRAPFSVTATTSLSRSYQIFRTMGLRHLLITDGYMNVVGMVTRADLTEHRLHHIWHHEGEAMIKSMNVEIQEPTFVPIHDGSSVVSLTKDKLTVPEEAETDEWKADDDRPMVILKKSGDE